MYSFYIALVIFIVILIIIIYRQYNPGLVFVSLNDRDWAVASSYENRAEAAQMLSEVNNSMFMFMRVLKTKYSIDATDDALVGKNAPRGYTYHIVDALLDNYNPEVFYENDPKISKDTSYTKGKGAAMYLCLRDRQNPTKFVDKNLLLFVMLHEASHIANYNGWGHDTQFWTVFKFILYEAAASGVYIPVDYSKAPINYCGLHVAYNPLYDKSLHNLWEL